MSEPRSYYNEFDPKAAQWLRNLIAAGLIPAGDVDERSIEDVTPSELRGYTQCHFFAGIGGWPLALALAGWPASRPVWTGSCPCQPFSAAGKGAGFADERHLWPAWQHLIAQCRPPVVFGEQVASKAVDTWIDLVHADLEGMGYAFGGIAFPAASVGAPHIRDRTYWVADAGSEGSLPSALAGVHRGEDGPGTRDGEPQRQGAAGWMADPDRFGPPSYAGTEPGVLEGADGAVRDGGQALRPGPTNGQWAAADWLGCTDGKWRAVEPGTFPLAHGLPARVVRLRAYGNAIVPAQAAEMLRIVMECRP